MKFAVNIKMPAGVVQAIHDHQISEHHKIHELINLEPKERLYYVKILALSALNHVVSKSSQVTLLSQETPTVSRIFTLNDEVARQFSISALNEMERTFPKEIHLLASNDVSHQDILRTVAELVYKAVEPGDFYLSDATFM